MSEARRRWPPSPRVLVVDDSVVVRKVLTVTLRQLPEFLRAEIDEAPNGALALRKMEAQRYDLVLSDIRMPAMDGLELLRAVRTDLKDAETPFVLISTLGTEGDVERGRAAGATGYIRKPITPHNIMTELQEILGLHRR
jgi:two-component system chemotaxis response regulator CheY